MSDGYERHDYNRYAVRKQNHTPDKCVPIMATEAWEAAKLFAEAFDLPDGAMVVVTYQTTQQVAPNAFAPRNVERTFRVSMGKLYGASEC